jgi:hypothetical protein
MGGSYHLYLQKSLFGVDGVVPIVRIPEPRPPIAYIVVAMAGDKPSATALIASPSTAVGAPSSARRAPSRGEDAAPTGLRLWTGL